MESFPENTDIFIKTTFRVKGTDTKIDPDGQEAYIKIENVSGDIIVTRVLMAREDEGIYSYWWETGAVGLGVFTVIVDGEFSGHTFVVEDRVELT